MKLDELLTGVEILELAGSSNIEIDAIEYDSRKCGPGSLFAALRGSATDGHKYIKDVIAKGAKAILCEDNILTPEEMGGATAIVVKNSRNALAGISHNYYGLPSKEMKMIGVTGTNGKTTITFLLKSIFEAAGYRAGIIGTTGIIFGGRIIKATHTTPESLELAGHLAEMKSAGVEVVIMEVSSHALAQGRADYIEFSAALFTNLTHEHLDYHKTMKEYASAKKILFDMLPEEAIAVVCDDSEYSDYILGDCKAKRKLKTGRSEIADIRIIKEELNISDTRFTISVNARQISFNLKLMGRFNIDNAAFCIVLCNAMGIEYEIIKTGLENTNGAPGRMERELLNNGAVGIVDYAHTPDALEKALATCKEVIRNSKSGSRLISVFGCGGDRDAKKRPEMGEISTRIADFSLITNDNPRTEDPALIIDDILEGINEDKKDNIKIIPDRALAIKTAVQISNENDIVLIAGKGHEDYQIIGKEKRYFDDRKELKKYSR